MLFALRRAQIGFLVDAAIGIGFTIGAGFAVVENVHYLRYVRRSASADLDRPRLRHRDSACNDDRDRRHRGEVARRPLSGIANTWWIRPGLVAAIVLHSVFNHALVSPLLAAGVLTLVLPLVVLVVFGESERRTREWVGDGLDLDVELLDLVLSEHFQATRLGNYLRELRTRFEGPVVADMFCLLRLELELSVQAKARIMARNAGLEMPVDDDLHESLAEQGVPAALDRSDGTAGAEAAAGDLRSRRLAPLSAVASQRPRADQGSPEES